MTINQNVIAVVHSYPTSLCSLPNLSPITATNVSAATTNVSNNAAAVSRRVKKVYLVTKAIAVSLTVETTTITEPSPPTRLAAKTRTGGTQTVAISEVSLTRLAAKLRAPSADTITISEPAAPTRVRGRVRAPSPETVTIGVGTAARLAGKLRSIPAQTVAITEVSLVRLASKIRALAAQTTTITEVSLTRLAAKKRAPSAETITIAAGTAARLANKIRALPAETLTVAAGTAARLAAKIRAIPLQTIAISDAISRTVSHGGVSVTRNVPLETTIVSEALTRRTQKIRALPSQTVIVAELLARIKGANRIIPAETVSIAAGTAARIKGAVKSIPAQTVTITEQSLTRLAKKIRAVPTQVLTIGETVTRVKTTFGANNVVRAMPPETVLIAENLVRRTQKIRSVALETIIVAENLARKSSKIRALPAQTVTITEVSLVRIKQKIRAVPTQAVLISDIIARKAAKTRIITEIVSIIEQIEAYKNGIRLLPPQRPDKGGWFWKPPKIKMIRYPVYVVPERVRLERRRKLREYPPLVIIPAFKFQINTVVAPFIVTDPIRQEVRVRFAIAPRNDTTLIYSGKTIPILLQPKQQQKRLNKAKCVSFIANQQAIERYGRKLDKLSKVMKVWSMAHQLFSSH